MMKQNGLSQQGSKLHVAIVGAGIGGLATALAMLCTGLEVDIFEQAHTLQAVGAGIHIGPNGARILLRFGLGAQIDAVAIQTVAEETRRWDDNHLLARFTNGEENKAKFGAPIYSFHRGELQHILREAVPDHIVHLNHRCIEVTQRPDRAELAFADGSIATADVVVGADGIHSILRNTMSTDSPRFYGLCSYRGLVPAERLPFLTKEPKGITWLGPQREFVCYPVSHGRLIHYNGIVPAAEWKIESWTAEGRVEDLAAEFSGWNEQVRQIIAAADKTMLYALYARDPLERWSENRLTLLGDAAHAMLPFGGQGSSQALEDAVALAACLRNCTQQTLAEGLKRYETLRKPRTTIMQQAAIARGDAFRLRDGDEQQQRDTKLNATNKSFYDWVYSYDVEQAANEAVIA
jgi:salicylate hydroxylase